jgi:hypothetical protein
MTSSFNNFTGDIHMNSMNKFATLKTSIAVLAFGGTLSISGAVFAAGLGGKADVGIGGGGGVDRGAAGVGVGGGVDAGARVDTPPASVNGRTNSNGAVSTDRELGQDRAAERRSIEGQAHEKADGSIENRNAKLRRPLPDADRIEPVK